MICKNRDKGKFDTSFHKMIPYLKCCKNLVAEEQVRSYPLFVRNN